jgi:hypothetical protein
VALTRTDLSEECIASIIREKRISELVPPNRRFVQEPHVVTSQTPAIFIVTAAKTAYLAKFSIDGAVVNAI